MTYAEYHTQLKDHKRSLETGRTIVPAPDLLDVDITTVPPEKRGLVQELIDDRKMRFAKN